MLRQDAQTVDAPDRFECGDWTPLSRAPACAPPALASPLARCVSPLVSWRTGASRGRAVAGAGQFFATRPPAFHVETLLNHPDYLPHVVSNRQLETIRNRNNSFSIKEIIFSNRPKKSHFQAPKIAPNLHASNSHSGTPQPASPQGHGLPTRNTLRRRAPLALK
jgi:hypothetical protein